MQKTSNGARKLLSNFDVIAQAPQGVAKLRELILTLAVQGKLVTQDASDEPASVLLQRIQTEKSRLVAEGRVKKEKPLPEIAEEEKLFKLPVGWEWVRLGAVMEMRNGKAFKPTEWKDAGLPIVRIQNLNNENAGFNYCDKNSVADKNLINNNEFLISWSGTPGTSFGAFIWRRGPAALNQHIFKCVLIGNAYVREFLRISINSQLNVLISQAQGGVGLQHVTKGTLERLVLVIPPLAEQSRIVARVESLMQLCDELEAQDQLEASQHQQLLQALLDSLTQSAGADELVRNWQRVVAHFDVLLDRPEAIDALEQTILQLAVRGLLVPQDPTDEPVPLLLKKIKEEKNNFLENKKSKKINRLNIEVFKYRLPINWGWTFLQEVVLVGPENGLSPKPSDIETKHKCLTLTSTTSGLFKRNFFKYVDISDKEAEANYLKNNDLLIQRGNSIEYVGIAAIYDSQDNEFIYPDLMMRLRLSSKVNLKYVHLALISKDGRDYFKSVATGTQGNMPKVNQTAVNSAPIPLPPLAEQSRIVARVSELRALCQQLRDQLSQARYIQGLLVQALVEQAAA